MNQSGWQHHCEGGAVFIVVCCCLALMHFRDYFDNAHSHTVDLGGVDSSAL